MKIVQLSDLHIRSGRALAFNAADSAYALERMVEHLQHMTPQPDCIVVSGDLAEHGEKDAYALVAQILSPLKPSLYVLPGNHDNRENLLAAFAAHCPADQEAAPCLCYTIEDGPVRLVIVDGSIPNAHSGCLHPTAARWLEKKLAVKKEIPTLIFTHHPPFSSGLGLMDEPYQNAEEFARILRGNPQARLCCGHLHRGMVTVWEGGLALCSPPLVMSIVPDFTPTGGDKFTLGTPSFLIHHYHCGQINSHFCEIPGDFPYAGPYSFAHPISLK
jgi:3',5'-cyclic AMP phosphodiesterase CpdA